MLNFKCLLVHSWIHPSKKLMPTIIIIIQNSFCLHSVRSVLNHTITEVPNRTEQSWHQSQDPYNSQKLFAPKSWHFREDGEDTRFKKMTTEDRLQNISPNTFFRSVSKSEATRDMNVTAANSVLGKNEFRVNLLSFTSLLWLLILIKCFY